MAGDLTTKLKKKPTDMEAAKMALQPPTPAISRATKSRIQRKPLSDRTNVITSSKGTSFSPAPIAGEDDSPGKSYNPLGLNSMPSCDTPSSSGVEISSITRAHPRTASTRKSKGKAVAISSASCPNRRSNNVRVECTSDITPSKQVTFFSSLNDTCVEAIKGDALGTSFDVLEHDSIPLRDAPSSSGCGVEFQTNYQKAATTRNSEGKEILASRSTSSYNGRSSRFRKRPGEVEERAVSKSCSVPNRKVGKSSNEVGDRAVSKSCTLHNKRRKQHQPPPDTREASKSLREFIRQQKSYFAEIDAFELPEEEVSNEDSE